MTDKFISIEGIARRYPGANRGLTTVFEDLGCRWAAANSVA